MRLSCLNCFCCATDDWTSQKIFRTGWYNVRMQSGKFRWNTLGMNYGYILHTSNNVKQLCAPNSIWWKRHSTFFLVRHSREKINTTEENSCTTRWIARIRHLQYAEYILNSCRHTEIAVDHSHRCIQSRTFDRMLRWVARTDLYSFVNIEFIELAMNILFLNFITLPICTWRMVVQDFQIF